MKKIISFLLAAAITSCSSPSEQKDVLVLGIHPDYPPYELVDEKGKITGFDVEVAEKIAAMMGKKLVIKQMGFDSLILSLKSKKVDILMSGMSITEQRKKEIAMVPYNGENITEMELIFWKKIPQGVESIHDLKNQVISAQTGTVQESILYHYDDVQHKSLDGIMEMMTDLKYGKSAALLVEKRISDELKINHPEIVSIVVPLSPETQILGDGIGVNKEATQLINEIESCVQAMKESGELQKLHKKWFHTGA